MTERRYTSLKTIADHGPEWARGCGLCNHGIVSAPEVTGAATFYLERLVQAVDGDIAFCECQAGKFYRVSLLNRHQKLIEEARRDERMIESARRKTHPDIENARIAMLIHYGKSNPPPTVHFDATPTPLRDAEQVVSA